MANRKQRRAVEKQGNLSNRKNVQLPQIAQKAATQPILKPSSEEIEYLVTLFNSCNYIEGEAFALQQIKRYPLHGFFWKALGLMIKLQGRTMESLEPMQKATSLMPMDFQAHSNLSITLKDLGRLKEAEACCRRALQIKPDYAEAHSNLGIILKGLGRLNEAEACCRRALEIKPDYAEAYSNLGTILKDLVRLNEAEACYRHALGIKPAYAEAHNNLGNTLKDLGCLNEAEACYRHALAIKPAYAEAHCNLGGTLKDLVRLNEAETCFRRAFEIQPDYTEAYVYLAILLLATERYIEGWSYYEYRSTSGRNKNEISVPNLPYPQWLGESLVDKSLVIWPEQGFGDYIQFVRYATLLKARGLRRLTLVCKIPLKALLETMECVDEIITDPAAVPTHDYWSFPLSLPLHFATTVETIPASLPYLKALPDRIDRWYVNMQSDSLKVGLVWKGFAGHKNDANRSMPELSTMAQLWTVPGITFFSLQKGQGEEEALQSPSGLPIISLGSEISDFADSAAIIEQLDLVICVDTAIAHVAGALCKPCWVLLPYLGTDWRWLQDRTDSPWYPGVIRLFRQTDVGDWVGVIERVVEALMEVCQAKATSHAPAERVA